MDVRRQTLRNGLPELHDQVRQQQHLRLRQRDQQRQIRLQQPAAIRWHLVSPVFKDMAYGDGGLRDVPAGRTQHEWAHQASGE